MINADVIKEVPCEGCIHKEVCAYKKDLLDICAAVSECAVYRSCSDGKVSSKNITNFDCLNDIVVRCKYFNYGQATPRNM